MKVLIDFPPFAGLSVDNLTKLMANYWDAIADLCPMAFRFPKKHQIQRTTGIFVLHRLLPAAFEKVLKSSKDKRVTRKGFRDLLSQITDSSVGTGSGEKVFQDEYWSSVGTAGQFGTSQKAFALLYSRIFEGLRALDEDESFGGISYTID